MKLLESEPIDKYVDNFLLAWDCMCKALEAQVARLKVMKKNRFLIGLRENYGGEWS